jgi:hypothetical protein
LSGELSRRIAEWATLGSYSQRGLLDPPPLRVHSIAHFRLLVFLLPLQFFVLAMGSFSLARSASLLLVLVACCLLLVAAPSRAMQLEVESESDLEALLEEQSQPAPAAPAIAQAPVAVQQSPVTTDPSGLTPAGTTPVGGEDQSEVGLCEVCMYVLENKMQHQPYLCKGLKDPHYQVSRRAKRGE